MPRLRRRGRRRWRRLLACRRRHVRRAAPVHSSPVAGQRSLGGAAPRWPPLPTWLASRERAIAEVVVNERLIRYLELIREALEVVDRGLIEAHGDGLLEALGVGVLLRLREIVFFPHRFHRASYWARSARVVRRAEIGGSRRQHRAQDESRPGRGARH